MTPPDSAATDPNEGNVLFISGDLMFASRVKAAAEQAGYQFQLAGRLPEGVRSGAERASLQYVILDLATRGSLAEEVAACADQCPSAKLIAYGPHVQEARLKAARDAGIPTVLTRGQFDRQLATLFSSS